MPSTWSGSSVSSIRGGGGSYGYKHTVVVPMSRDGAEVFPTNKTTGKIDPSMYQPEMTQNLISTEGVASFLQGIDAFVQPVFKSDFITLMKWLPWITAIVLFVLIIIMMLAIMGFIKTSISSFMIPLITLVIMVILGITLSVLNCVMVKHVKRKIKEAKEKIQPYLQQYNGAFQAKGYYWVAPANFPYWIELRTARANQRMPVVVNMQQPMGGFNMQQQYMMLPQQQTPSYIGGYGAESQFNSPLQQQQSFSPA